MKRPRSMLPLPLLLLAVLPIGLIAASSSAAPVAPPRATPRRPPLGNTPSTPSTPTTPSTPSTPSTPTKPTAKERQELLELLRGLAGVLDSEFGWPELPDFLQSVAYTESRYNNRARNPEPGPNAARGWFGGRPTSMLVAPLSSARGDDLYEPRIAVATAADYAWRLRKYRKDRPAAQLTCGDIRRGWALPSLVSDFTWSKARSQDVRTRMLQAQQATKINLIDRPLFRAGQSWPGLAAALKVFDIDPAGLT